MKELNRVFWGTFIENSKHGDSKEFENWVDEFVEISEFDSVSEMGKIFNDHRIVFKGFEDDKDCKVILLENRDNFDISIATSLEYFSENKIEILNEVIETCGLTTTSKGNEPIYKLIGIEVVK